MLNPNVPKIEKAVIAAILREAQLLEYAQAAGIDDDCFFNALYRQIWGAMCRLTAQGVKVDDLALITEMPSQAAEIAEIPDSIATTANFSQWLETLKEYKARRVLAQEAYRRQDAIGKNTGAKTLLDAMEAAGVSARTILESGKSNSMQEAAAEVLDSIDNPRPPLPIFPAGTEAADKVRFHAGETVVIAAKTGCGKTALAAQMAAELLKAGKVVLYACTESSAAVILSRLAAALTGISHNAIMNDKATAQQKERFKEVVKHLSECPRLQVIGCEGGLITAGKICNELKGFRLRQGRVDCVVVDFVQNLKQAAEDARKSRLEWLNDAIQRLHDAFIEERATGVFLAQFNRSGSNSDAPPDLKDLKDTSTLEQLADLVCMLYRPENDARTLFYTPKHRNMEYAKLYLGWNGTAFTSQPEYSAADRPPAVTRRPRDTTASTPHRQPYCRLLLR